MQLSLMTFMYEIPMLMSGPWNDRKSAAMEEILHIAKETGFTGVDLTSATVGHMGLSKVRDILQREKLQLMSLICFAHLAEPALSDDEALLPYIDAIQTAKALSCDHLMLVPGKVKPDTDPDEIRRTLIRRFTVLTGLAAKEGILCMIEDDPDLKVGMCRESDVAAFLQAVPGLKLVYDSANMIVAGEDPVTFYEALHASVIHTHIKDIRICEDPSMYRDEGPDGVFYASAPHGCGMLDFKKLFHSFGRFGYQGVLSLEYVPSQNTFAMSEEECAGFLQEDLRRIYRMFAALSCKYTLGINEVPLLSKLIPGPEENVWEQIRKRGIHAVEICILPEATEKLRAYEEEIAKRFNNPRSFARGEEIPRFVARIRAAGLQVYSAHVMLCEAYPQLLTDNISYLREISKQTGIRQFVVSCSFETEEMAKQYLPYLQAAAAALKEDDIFLCYHNHHQDSVLLENGCSALEMVLKECPDVMVQFDVGWAWYGRQDRLEFMRTYGDRIVSVHLKDLTEDARERTDAGRFTAIGSGAARIREVLENLPLCRLAPGKLIIDQDASSGDMYDDIASGAAFVQAL